MALPFVVREITRLSQEEGLNDKEIAETLGCSRATINRARSKEKIPKANLEFKKDKTYICYSCGGVGVVRRNEKKQLLCEACKIKKKQLDEITVTTLVNP